MRTERSFVEPRAEILQDIVRNRPFLTFPAEAKIEHIVREMIRRRQGVAGIMAPEASGRLAGLLTERDILRKIFGAPGETEAQHDARQRHLSVYPGSLTARDVMTVNPVCLTDTMPIEEALDKIKHHGFRYMPVVRHEDPERIVGIVSERELFHRAQERFNRTLRTQRNLLSYFIHEPYGSGATIESMQ